MEKYKLAKYGCYFTGFTMSVSATLSPLLFLTFREMYNVSFTMLGFLVVINFFTQLLVDLIFTFFTKHFDMHKSVRFTPFIVFIGLMVYAIMPRLFPDMAFLWILIGTVAFAIGSGLSEVLVSPVIAAIPSDNPEREMSKMHSVYAWGVSVVVILSTLYIKVFGGENWMYLTLIWSVVPLTAFILYMKSELPPMDEHGGGKKNVKIFNKGVILCTLCIFFGGAAECTMAQWASGFIENAIGVSKVYGDVIGVATFSALLGLGRTLYSKFGKNVINVLLVGMLGACICYFTASLALNPVIGIIACALTGICTSMLWPGSLIYVDERFENVGVAIYALMASGGDLGASLAPQLLGIISDKFSLTEYALKISQILNISAEQVSMRAGLLVTGLFPVAGVICILYMKKYFKNREKMKL